MVYPFNEVKSRPGFGRGIDIMNAANEEVIGWPTYSAAGR
jgi:hypothetical protein